MPVIGTVGAFDIADLGGLLFPLLAEQALTSRLVDVELRRYASGRERPDLFADFRPLGSLAAELDGLDLLVVGRQPIGAAVPIVDADHLAAPPDQLRLDQWAVPSLLGAGAGVPVVWAALELSIGLPSWLAPVTRAAVDATAYASLRDAASAERFAQFTGRSLPVVPDPAFALVVGPGSIWDRAGERCRAEMGVEGDYVLVQSARDLRVWAEDIDRLVGKARAEGCRVIVTAMSAAEGDAPGVVPLTGPTLERLDWPGPVALAGLIAGAAGVIGSSTSLAALACANGVPVWRPPAPPSRSAGPLALLPSVYTFHEWDPGALGRSQPGPEVGALAGAVDAQWDEIAAVVGRPGAGREVLVELIEGLPQLIEGAGQEVRVTSSGAPPAAGRGRHEEPTRERESLDLVEAQLVEVRHVNRYQWAASLLPKGSVLDAGCGTATGAAVLAAAGHEVTAVDIDTALLEAARPFVPPSVTLRHASIDALPFATASFDAVVCLETLNLVEDVGAALDELRRVLAPGGHLVISTESGKQVSVLHRLAFERFGWVGSYVQRDWYASAIVPMADLEQVSTVTDGAIGARHQSVEHTDATAALLIAGDGPLVPVPAAAQLTDTATVDRLLAMLAERHQVARDQLDHISSLERQRDEVVALRRQLLEAEQLIAREPQQRELIARLTDQFVAMERHVEQADELVELASERVELIEASTSWRVSAPLRKSKEILNWFGSR